MTIPTPGERATKSQKREHARELARVTREADRKKKLRRRWITQGSIAVAVLAVAAIAVFAITSNNNVAATTAAGPLNMQSDGIVFTGTDGAATAVTTPALKAGADPVATSADSDASVAKIVTYIDYQCPYCKQFEDTNLTQIEAMVAAGTATLEVHPISILDNSSLGTKYSTRSANAAACVANYEPDKFLVVSAALFANQPEEGTSGLKNSALQSLVSDAGATNSKIASCITDGTYGAFNKWVTAATARALAGPLPNTTVAAVSSTPTVLVNGAQYSGSLTDPTVFSAFVTAQVAAAKG